MKLFDFPKPELSPRPDLEGPWELISIDELLERAPECTQLYFDEVRSLAPTLLDEFVFVRHEKAGGDFGVRISRAPEVAVGFDSDLDYICVWKLGGEHGGEFGDWGQGMEIQAQVAATHTVLMCGEDPGHDAIYTYEGQ